MKKNLFILIPGAILLFSLCAFAQDIIVAGGEKDTGIGLGGYALTPILLIILGVIYRFKPDLDNRWKTLIALLCGGALGLVTIQYDKLSWDFQTVVDRLLYGFITVGAGAIGLDQVQKAYGIVKGVKNIAKSNGP